MIYNPDVIVINELPQRVNMLESFLLSVLSSNIQIILKKSAHVKLGMIQSPETNGCKLHMFYLRLVLIYYKGLTLYSFVEK